jgi:heterodisulfide reductase subunit A
MIAAFRFANQSGDRIMAEENIAKSRKKQEEKVGVYICHCGGNISDHVDVEEVRQRAEKIPGVTVARRNMFMCSDPGQAMIAEDLKSGAINRVVVASCAPSLHEMTFRNAISRTGANPYLYDHANIREQVSWVHDGPPATDKATKLVEAAVAKTAHLSELSPIRVPAKKHVTVIGGGLAGMRAARDLSLRGLEVALVEKSPFLGGQASRLDKLVPTGERAGDLIKQLADEILHDENVTAYTCAQVAGSEGYVGNFRITVERRPPETDEDLEKLNLLKDGAGKVGDFFPFAGVYPMGVPTRPEELDWETGSIVFATGFQTYVPAKDEYGYGSFPEVITLPRLIRTMAENPSFGGRLRINGKEIRRAAFVHCVGSRQIPGIHEPDKDGNLNEYCSRVCCSAVLQAVSVIRENYPETLVLDYYRDIRTYGRGQEEFYERASKNNVVFMRFEPESSPVVSRVDTTNSDYPLKVTVKDTLTFGEELEAEVDLVVLAVGMQPRDISDMVEMMKLPVGADRFLLEVHPKLRPVELANTGMLLAGTCQAPMDVGEACAAAQAASVKASNLLTRGYVELDPFVAEVDAERCTGCGDCVKVCPLEGTIQMEDREGKDVKSTTAQVNPALCNGCGICVGACPEGALNINGWTLEQYEAMVDAVVGTGQFSMEGEGI